MAKPIKAPPTAPYDVVKERNTISDVEIAQAAYNAGFRGTALATIVAIALGESHGNRTALNNRGEFSVGLWQINVNGYLKSRLTQWGFSSWQDLWIPDNAAKAAYSISNGGKRFGAWSIYKHNAHLKFMDRATAAANTVSNPQTVTPSGTTTQPSYNKASTYYPITDPSPLPGSNVRLGTDPALVIIIAGALGALLIGIILLTRKRES
jgi:hypothetical protein